MRHTPHKKKEFPRGILKAATFELLQARWCKSYTRPEGVAGSALNRAEAALDANKPITGAMAAFVDAFGLDERAYRILTDELARNWAH